MEAPKHRRRCFGEAVRPRCDKARHVHCCLKWIKLEELGHRQHQKPEAGCRNGHPIVEAALGLSGGGSRL